MFQYVFSIRYVLYVFIFVSKAYAGKNLDYFLNFLKLINHCKQIKKTKKNKRLFLKHCEDFFGIISHTFHN